MSLYMRMQVIISKQSACSASEKNGRPMSHPQQVAKRPALVPPRKGLLMTGVLKAILPAVQYSALQ